MPQRSGGDDEHAGLPERRRLNLELSDRIGSIEAQLEGSRVDRLSLRREVTSGRVETQQNLSEIKAMLREGQQDMRGMLRDHEDRIRRLEDSRSSDRGKAEAAGRLWGLLGAVGVGIILFLIERFGR